MSKENTLLDAMAKENQSLAELLGMDEAKTEDISLLKKLAEDGNKNMMTLLGVKYMTGDGVPQDTMEAMYWLEKSGDFVSLTTMGDFYKDNGEVNLAEESYLKAAEKAENPCATYMKLISMFLLNKDTRDIQKTDMYLKAAFAAASNEEQKNILYDAADILCDIISKDDKEGHVYWLSKSLERKEDEKKRSMVELLYAQALVGENSTEESKRNAAEYFEKRGDQAINNGVIGMFYYYNDAAMDVEKRIIWTKRAADRGWANAQLIMSLAYLGKEYNKKIILDQDLDACLQYADLLDKNPKATAKDKETVAKIRNTVKAERDRVKAAKEKHLTQDIADQLWEECQKNGGKVLRIPDGYTHIDTWAFFDTKARNKKMKNLKDLEEVIIPDSVRLIDGEAFNGVPNLTKITLPSKLEYLGLQAFTGTTLNFLGMLVKDKRTVEKMIIPKDCEVAIRDYQCHAFTGIHGIRELVFEEGRKSINCTMFCYVNIDHLYIPDSVTEYTNPKIADCKIKSISAPAHLKPLVSQMKVKNITYR